MKLPEGLGDAAREHVFALARAQRSAARTTAHARSGLDEDSADTGAATPVDGLEALLRAGDTIVRYVLVASLRPRANDANLQYATALQPLWVDADDSTESAVSRALITVQGFARTAETQSIPADPERIGMLSAISGELRDAAYETPWYPHLLEGDRWGDVLGYQAPLAASRARTVWRAISDLESALDRGITFPAEAPPVPAIPVLPFPTTARLAQESLTLDALWAVPPAPAPPPRNPGRRGLVRHGPRPPARHARRVRS